MSDLELCKLRTASPASGTVELIRRCHWAHDRIEALEAQNRELALDVMAAQGQICDAQIAAEKVEAQAARIAELEAALRLYAEGEWPDRYPGGVLYAAEGETEKNHLDYGEVARTAMKGQTHD